MLVYRLLALCSFLLMPPGSKSLFTDPPEPAVSPTHFYLAPQPVGVDKPGCGVQQSLPCASLSPLRDATQGEGYTVFNLAPGTYFDRYPLLNIPLEVCVGYIFATCACILV